MVKWQPLKKTLNKKTYEMNPVHHQDAFKKKKKKK